ncbi:estradiol 17-beta-dehydrogenase 11-like isoform X2 [Ptychodera flava]|uniref:estradiol 17-beta-dehydrogenase 11-like isoform X2 n=1 Tax=Ptychodera flava TaxID=63121 RepID=UPI00396A74E6
MLENPTRASDNKLQNISVPPGRKNVDGQVVLITGAGHGIGRCLAIEFAKLGAHLVLWDIDETGVVETADELRGIGARVTTYTVDVSKKDNVRSVAERVKQEIGDVDILVNNAGITNGLELLKLSDSQIERLMDVNIMAHFWTVRAFLPAMLERQHGHIVSIASVAGKRGTGKLVDYSASKFAVVGFTEALAMEIREMKISGVYTTTVMPFFVDTEMIRNPIPRIRFPRLHPILKPESVASEIVDGVLRNKVEVMIPSSLKYGIAIKNPFVPRKVLLLLEDFLDFGVEAKDKDLTADKDKDA